MAGINAAKALGNTKFDVWLIDKTNHHLFQPLLYQVASASLSPGDIGVPIREILSPYENATVLMGEVTEIDKDNHQVVLRNGDRIGYEYLIVAPERATPILATTFGKSMRQALKL